MTPIYAWRPSLLRAGLTAAVRWLNQPAFKRGFKQITGTFAFVSGLFEIYDLYQISRGQPLFTEELLDLPRWLQIATKVALLAAKVSLILSAATSKPGAFFLSALFSHLLPKAPFERLFGPNTTFALNPRHPRHVASLAATILGLPSVIRSMYPLGRWISRGECPRAPQRVAPRSAPRRHIANRSWAQRARSDETIQGMALFNTLTGRPLQHLGNQF